MAYAIHKKNTENRQDWILVILVAFFIVLTEEAKFFIKRKLIKYSGWHCWATMPVLSRF